MEWHGLLPINKASNKERVNPKQQAANSRSLKLLDQKLIQCDACPRLVQWRNEIAQTKRRAYIDQDYWGKPVTGFGPSDAKLLVVGLAPGAHGANRTGRIFTGDSSGDWLYRALYNNGLAKIPTSTGIKDGQELFDTRIVCAVRCAPPGNKPTTEEFHNCEPWLYREVELLMPTTRSYLALGAIAWRSIIDVLLELGEELPRNRPKFSHGAQFKFQSGDGNTKLVIGSYHPSQQNTFTGKLTAPQLDSVVKKAGRFAHAGKPL